MSGCNVHDGIGIDPVQFRRTPNFENEIPPWEQVRLD